MERKSTIKLLTATLALAIVGGATALANNAVTTASAEETTFYMDTVAAVRVPDENVAGDVSGIRFYAHMDETTRTKAVENGYGFLIFPQSKLDDVVDGNYHALAKRVEITGKPEKIYSNGAVYTANGVLAPVNTDNYNVDFTCVAWVAESPLPENYEEGNVAYTGEFTYAEIDETFSRSVLQVASAAYIAEAENRSALATAYGLGTTNPVQINTADDLYALSAAVADGESFSGTAFALNDNVTVDCDYTPVAENFAGTFSYGDNKITIVNGGNTLKTAFANADLNDGVVVNTAALTATAKTADRTARGQFVENASLPNIADSSYTGNALLRTDMKNVRMDITLNYTAEELQELYDAKTYAKVSITYYVDHTAVVTNSTSDGGDKSLFTLCNLGNPVRNAWTTITVSVPQLVSAMTADKLLLIRTWIENSTEVSFNMYIGDIVLHEYTGFTPSALTQGKVYFSGNNHTYGYVKNADIPTECEWVDHNSATQTATIDNTLGYTGDAIQITNVYNGNYWYVNMDYTTNEYEMVKDKYQSVIIYYMLAMEVGKSESWGLRAAEGENGYNGALSLANASMARHKWLKAELTFEQFLMAMEKGNATEGVDDHRLFLGAPGWHGSCYLSLYLGEIKLVEREIDFIPTANKTTAITDTGWTDSYQSYYTYVANADLPTDGIDNTVRYTGDAIKLPAWKKSKLFVALDYTASEYEAMADTYESVTISYLITSTCSSTNAGDLLASADLTKNKWNTVTFTLADFVAAMRADDADENTLFLLGWASGPSSGYNHNFYLGEIKLVEKAQ